MSRAKPEIAPDEIRAIRESLGLTQVEAGELLGGGPRAFTKYEAGTVKPSASVISLLRLLEANPATIITLSGRKPRPIFISETSPMEVTGEHIAALTERSFPVLLRRLLNAEAQANDLPVDDIHVASSVTTVDAGEDGRIKWSDGPARTAFLPSRFTLFQLKAGKISPATAAADVLTKQGTVKGMIREGLEADSHYIMLSAHPYTEQQIKKREKAIRDALHSAGITPGDDRIEFRDADQIATWVNHHNPVAIWVLERTQPGLIGPFRSWTHWAGRAEHDSSPWVEDERLPILAGRLREQITAPRGIVRIVGPSGVGKSRLTLEALRPTEDEEAATAPLLSDVVLYAVESEAGSMAIKRVVQNLADSSQRAIVVIDRCSMETHKELADMVARRSGRLSLVTIDDEIPSEPLAKTTLKVEEAPIKVIEAIIDRISPSLQTDDRRRLVHFSKGFPKIAILVSQTWSESRPIAHATDDELVDSFILGRKPRDPELIRKCAALMATFGLVGVKHPADLQLDQIAAMGRAVSTADLRFAVEELTNRGVAQRRGKAVILQPRPIALKLVERQWREWSRTEWDKVLAGETAPKLKVMAARQLALLNTTEISQNVVNHVCRQNGPFDDVDGISQPGHAEVLSALAEIDSKIVASQIERSFKNINDLSSISGDVRRHLVGALEKIAFHPDTFEEGARLLLRLAVAENETWGNNATGQFKALFPVLLGNTAADADARHSILDEAANSGDPAQHAIVVEALIAGSETHHFSRAVGAEIHGSRPAMESWHPTGDVAAEYVKGCVTRLAKLAKRNDEAGSKARTGLGHHLRALARNSFIDAVETVVRDMVSTTGYWLEALESLGDFLIYDAEKNSPDVIARVKTLIAELKPEGLESRVHLLVTEMPWDYPCDEKLSFEARTQRQSEAISGLVADLIKQPETLAAFLPQLSRGRHRMTYTFGVSIAELAEAPLDWLEPITSAVEKTEESERNYDLLSGYLRGIAQNHSTVVEAVKKRAANSRELAPALPLICSRLEIAQSDIELVIGALQSGLLPPSQLMQWTAGGVLAKLPASSVAPLFDVMLNHSADAFAVALDLMGMYGHGEANKLEGLRPQIRKAAENATRWKRSYSSQMEAYHFESIMEWVLRKGREDPDARATALTLARALADTTEYENQRLIKPLIPILLSGFPEIVWPLIGQAIILNQERAWSFECVLGDKFAFDGKNDPALLKLPEDTLFAWCHAHPETAPAFVAALVPVLTPAETESSERSLHPVITRLLNEFGEREDVLQATTRNIHTFGWSGSRTTYYALYERPMNALLDHPKLKVRRWAKNMLRLLGTEIENARNEDEEQEAWWEI